MIHLSVCVPTTGLCRAEHTLSMIQFALHFALTPADPERPRQHIVFRQYQSSCISNARQSMARASLDEGATHVLFVDEDIEFAPDAPMLMLARQLPLVACNYKIRFEGWPFTAYTPDFSGRIATRADSPDLEECGATGFGLCLIAREVFEAMEPPWFPLLWDPAAGVHTTEDIPFFTAARAAGFPALIDHAASRRIAHHGNYRYRWDDPRDLSPS
jgi:hypothetical protein